MEHETYIARQLHDRPIAVGIPNRSRPQGEPRACQTDGEVSLRAVHVAIVTVARRSKRLSLTPRVGELEIVLNDPQVADVQPQLAEVCAPRVLVVDVLVGTRRGRAAVGMRLVLVEDGIVLLRLHRNVFPRRDALHLVAVDAHDS